MAKVMVHCKPGEDKLAGFNRAMKKFKKEVEKEGIIKEVLDRRYFTSNTQKRKNREKAARRKQLKQYYREKRNY